MPVIFNQADKPACSAGQDVQVRTLIDADMTTNDNVRLERWDMGPGSMGEVAVEHGDIVWVQVLEGTATLDGSQGLHARSDVHLVFLPAGFTGTVQSNAGAALLLARVPDAVRFDPEFAARPSVMPEEM